MHPVTCGKNRLLRMQATRRAQGHEVQALLGKHLFDVLIGRHPISLCMLLSDRGIDITDGRQFKMLRVTLYRAKMIRRDPAASDDGDPDLPVYDHGIAVPDVRMGGDEARTGTR